MVIARSRRTTCSRPRHASSPRPACAAGRAGGLLVHATAARRPSSTSCRAAWSSSTCAPGNGASPSSIPGHGPAGGARPTFRRRSGRRPRLACSSTCATCRCRLPERADRGGTCWPPGRPPCGPGAEPWPTWTTSGSSRRPADRSGRRCRVRGCPGRSCRSSRPGIRSSLGTPIAERLRDARVIDVVSADAARRRSPVAGSPAGSCCSTGAAAGGSQRGDMTEPIETPVAGIVREVRPGSGIIVRAAGRALRGIVVLGGPPPMAGSADRRRAGRGTARERPRRRVGRERSSSSGAGSMRRR